MRAEDVVDQHQVAGLPRLPHGQLVAGPVDRAGVLLAEAGAVAEVGGEWQAVLAEGRLQDLADLRVDGPPVPEGDVV